MSQTTKGTIYKIICKLDHKFVYIGSTFNSLRNRWQNHKQDYSKWLSDPENISKCACYPYFKKFGIQNFKMVEIKSYTIHLKDRRCLEARETLWISKTRGCCNKNLPIQYLRKEYDRQYRQGNSESIAEYKKQYYQDNRESLAEKMKQYYQDNRESVAEKVKQYRQDNSESIAEYKKQYYQDNRESLAEYKKQYHQDHKTEITEKRAVKMTCQCGSVVSKRNIATHRKSKKHQAYVATQTE